MGDIARGAEQRRAGLPAMVLMLGYVVALLAPLALALASRIAPASPWGEAASAVGMAAAVALMLQFVTSGRFEALSGRIGIDVTMAFHKWTARVLFIVVLVHPLLFVAPTFLDDPASGLKRLGLMLIAPRYTTGVAALLMVGAIVRLAIFRDRLPAPYEFWRATHLVMAITAAVLVTLHAMRAGTYSHTFPLRAVWPLLTLLVLTATFVIYGMRTLRMRRRQWVVVRNRRVADDLFELVIRPDGRHRLAYRAGQFAWVAVAPRLFPLFDHPFSIGSSPATGDELRFLVKRSGDFTNRVDAIAPPGTHVGLDAPHGSFVLDNLEAEAVLLVAGGIGIAPILALLEDLAARGDRRPVRLVYRCLSPSRMIASAEIDERARGLDFAAIYSVREPGEDWPFETGRLDRALLVRAMTGLDPARTVAMICGPGPMMVAVSDALHDLGLGLSRIRYERFDYADKSRSAKNRRVMWTFRAMGIAIIAAIAAFALR